MDVENALIAVVVVVVVVVVALAVDDKLLFLHLASVLPMVTMPSHYKAQDRCFVCELACLNLELFHRTIVHYFSQAHRQQLIEVELSAGFPYLWTATKYECAKF